MNVIRSRAKTEKSIVKCLEKMDIGDRVIFIVDHHMRMNNRYVDKGNGSFVCHASDGSSCDLFFSAAKAAHAIMHVYDFSVRTNNRY